MSLLAPALGETLRPTDRQVACPGCGAAEMQPFYAVKEAPVHSVLLMPTREVAVEFPRRDIVLASCLRCGFISNVVFDPSVHSYSSDYEETQGYSAVFREFHRNLALRLIEKFNLRGKNIVEIGCGKGEFLALLAELGNNHGTGFDPAFVAGRNPVKQRENVQFIVDFYSGKYSDVKADFICCKMTLEHIWNTHEFVSTVRHSIGNRRDCIVFFQIPNMERVLHDAAFWDVYYEHCSYFTAASLHQLFERSGFEVLEIGTEYDDQYLTIFARPAREMQLDVKPLQSEQADALLQKTEGFRTHSENVISGWRTSLDAFIRDRKKVVIWGSGSKGVAFLTALGPAARVDYVVDINPYRQGKFMAGTGQEIVAPDFLKGYAPDVAIAMNAIYRSEIQKELDRMELTTTLLTV